MKAPKMTDDVEIETPPSKPSTEALGLSPSHGTLITSRRETEKTVLSLYESKSGQYFVHRQDETGENTTPVPPAAAGKILAMETRRHMARIFRRKLESPAVAKIQNRKLDTTNDEIVSMECDDDVEAGAVYRTARGVEYLRLVNPWRDVVILFKKSEWADITASLDEWLRCDRSFLTFLDWPHLREVSELESIEINESSHDIEPWLRTTSLS
jgi:hypothetical protein